MVVNLDDYITLSPEGFPILTENWRTLDFDGPYTQPSYYIVDYLKNIIKDGIQGDISYAIGKTPARYGDCFKLGLRTENGSELIEAMNADPAFEPFINLIKKGMTENPNTSTPFEPWHATMRQYVVDNMLPAKENIPLFVANYRKAYFPKDPKASLPIGAHLITAENRYAARMPSVKDLVRKEILGFSLNFLTDADKGKAIVSFPIQHIPELADSMAVLRAKAEVKGAKKPWPKDPTGKGPLIEERFKDVQEALDCPETRIHIVYNENHKAVAYALTQQTTPSKINVSYVCSNEKGASKTLWRNLLTENITCITANNVTNPVTHDYFEHMGLVDIGDGTKDMHLKNGNLAKQKRRLGI